MKRIIKKYGLVCLLAVLLIVANIIYLHTSQNVSTWYVTLFVCLLLLED